MQKIPYASAVRSLMYAPVCTRPDIAYIVGVLGIYLSNPRMDHWKTAKKSYEVIEENKVLYAHIQEVRSIGDHWVF